MQPFADQPDWGSLTNWEDVLAASTRLGVVSPHYLRDVQVQYALTDRATEALVSELIARDVWVLPDATIKEMAASQASIFSQDRHRWNCLFNELPLRRILAPFLLLPRNSRQVDIDWFLSPRRGRQYIREFSRLRLIAAGNAPGTIVLSEAFRTLQSALWDYLDAGYIPDVPATASAAGWDGALALASRTCGSPFFGNALLPAFRQHYLSLPEVAKWVSWIAACNRQPASMHDIVLHALERGEEQEFWWIALGDAPSSAPAAIRNGRDVCFRCLRVAECTPHFGGRYDPGNLARLLSWYREERASEFLNQASNGKIAGAASSLAQDSMLTKFVVSYSVAVCQKSLLGELGILDGRSAVLRKDAGRYCPRADLWSLDTSKVYPESKQTPGEVHD